MATTLRALVAILTGILAAGCIGGAPDDVRLGTTTSVQDSGLLDALVGDFEDRTGRRVRAAVQGTGAVLDLARRGEVDVVLVHEPEQERRFVADGFGEGRILVMYNSFVLVGPPDDPAATAGSDIDEAFRRIASAGTPFVSRGDRSGTDVMERSIWPRAGAAPAEPWYIESGVGQAQSLIVASERRAYMLVDRGTFLSQRSRLELEILVDPEPMLVNPYHAIAVSPSRAPAADREAAAAWIAYLGSEATQRLIADLGRDRYGEALFSPAAGRNESELP